MIQSILDNDQYKFTMQQAVLRLFPEATVSYKFKNRGNHKFPDGFDVSLLHELTKLNKLKLTNDEKVFVSKIRYFTDSYVEYLSNYSFNPHEVSAYVLDNELHVEIEGPWYTTILWEVPLMSTISELYFKSSHTQDLDSINEALFHKKTKLHATGLPYADFGTRRRYSLNVHDTFIKEVSKHYNFVGTSNLHLAHKYQIKPIGTQAHEWYMYHAAKYGPRVANRIGLRNWQKIYNGDLGIALPDTYTTDVFLRHFDLLQAKSWDGVRHDSGDPIEFGEKIIKHYNKLGIDPTTKTIVFSDSINSIEVMEKIRDVFNGRIKFSFGIGTWLTNDVGVLPLNMVIKLDSVFVDDWYPAVKLSDVDGKVTGATEEAELYRKLLRI